eukprot:TRINITY_DN5287_c0_g1_i2.p1 TRINITY_DN5287_c0_g1~~TRINITY_DN5287_c0_g1_i2.p1  ORF type:complete len:293 (-),score=56.46 TRINITY_DN5287_c0_g1_i2:73-951(-)
MARPANNGSSLFFSVFSFKDANSTGVPLRSCCDKCGPDCIIFRCLSVRFDSDGKCKVPITLQCSPTHSRRARTTSLVLVMQITLSNGTSYQGQTDIPFKKHKPAQLTVSQASLDSIESTLEKIQQQLGIAKRSLQNFENLVVVLPQEQAVVYEPIRQCASRFLETENNSFRKRKTREDEEEDEVNVPNTLFTNTTTTTTTMTMGFAHPSEPTMNTTANVMYPSFGATTTTTSTTLTYPSEEMINTLETSNDGFTIPPYEPAPMTPFHFDDPQSDFDLEEFVNNFDFFSDKQH